VLIIRRRAGESLLIGDDVEIEVMEVGAGGVKLGITAPREVLILRSEIRLAEQENLTAMRTVSSSSVAALVARFRKR